MKRTIFYPFKKVDKRSLFVLGTTAMIHTLFMLLILAIPVTNAFAQFPEILWEREGEGPHSQYGGAIMPLGDQNDDGFADWAVLGIGDWPPDPPNHSVLEFFHGGNPPDSNPYQTWLLEPDHMVSPFYGFTCGDLNGDGYTDWYLAYRTPGGSIDSRTYEVYFGGPYADEEVDFTFSIEQEHWIYPLSGYPGNRVDFNADGYDDLVVYYQIFLDRTEILFGAEIMDSEPDWIVHSIPAGSQSAMLITTGDFDGDGSTDIVCSDSFTPTTTYIYRGEIDPDTLVDYEWPSVDAWPSCGEADLNHDGFADLVRSRGGVLYIDLGPLNEVPENDAQFDFPGCSGIATTLTSARDFNHDGYDDFVAVSPGCAWWGKLSLYLGGRWIGPNSAFDIYGRTPPLNIFAISEAEGVGDINGDGIDDLAIGGYDSSTEGERGKAVIISGDTSFIAPVEHTQPYIADELRISLFPNPANSMVTLDIAIPAYGQAVDIGIYNLLGQRVDFFQLHSTANAQLKYNVSELPTGVYLISATADLQSTIKRLVVIR